MIPNSAPLPHLTAVRIDSPVGPIVIVSNPDGLCAVEFEDKADRVLVPLRRRYGPVELTFGEDRHGAADRLRAYLAGDLSAIDPLPVSTAGTPFQETVWAALRGIPVGTTVSYGGLARRLGQPGAMRAVGLANGQNPIGIVVPCHRVIGSDGSLTGYGGGIERKRWLLRHEGFDVTPAGKVRPAGASGQSELAL
jgi:methylated-DNA-[protein]-cysteine S-methyltransferase